MPQYRLINEKMIAVDLAKEEAFAKRGAMVCYTGDVRFSRSFLTGGGIQELAMRSVTNEGYSMMKASGVGTVYYAHNGHHVTIVQVSNSTFYVESETLLAFDGRLRPGTMFLGNQGGVQGVLRGAVSGQGLFTSTLEGTGEVAILSDGNAIALEVSSERPVFVDPNAYLGHVGQLSSKVVTDLNWKTFVGQTSGESYQVKFSGSGRVYIQASER
ncbi:MAG: AIM24 family protein [Deltaproteobacteria bacterium]|nr:AIM24 family protein [Deltaproteobacteria bacterium]